MTTQSPLGTVDSLWRYPIKSMMGEELGDADLGATGLLGDRHYALVDQSDGKVASAKNPRKWPGLFDFSASFIERPAAGARATPVRITLPDGTRVSSDQEDCGRILSRALTRDVRLATADERVSRAEGLWPDMEGLPFRDTVREFGLLAGTFFDCAAVHLLTTGSLERLGELHPRGRFEARRFRPNILVKTEAGARGFVEGAWVGHTIAIGDEVHLQITGPCGRCVMTTLPQGDLLADPEILRAAAQHNHAKVGVYAAVVRGGAIHRGDRLSRLA